jgi:hypothetical protein
MEERLTDVLEMSGTKWRNKECKLLSKEIKSHIVVRK